MAPVRSSLLRRRGVIAPMAALFSVFLLAMVAFAIDTSWIVLTQSELQNAADSAALAGCQSLYQNYAATIAAGAQSSVISSAVTNAKTNARTYAGFNSAGGVASLTLPDGDISIGFTDSSGRFTAYTNGSTTYPNTIKVTTRRDATANNQLSLFFGQVVGTSQVSLTATATCTLYTGVINSFKSSTTGLLPFTYDVNSWKDFIATGKDIFGQVSVDANGNPQVQVYDTSNDKGNFGGLSLDDSHVGASVTADWIANGASADDIAALKRADLIPISAHGANTWDWNGENGFKASNVSDVNARTGQTFYLPLFTPKNSDPSNYAAGDGGGSNYNYNIVAFVPVTLMPTDRSNRFIIVEPASAPDNNAIFDLSTVTPAGTSSNKLSVAMPPKLSN